MHLDRWPGYKSGALNFALAQTSPDAEIIGVIDADYVVESNYLRDLIPAFSDDQVAFLQTPQDYRDYQGNPFLRASYYAYKYFFEVSMPSRNEHNAIIFGGTMGLIRKSVLQQVGGWDEWCITEDAELSLRILKAGYRSIYINRTYGRGLMPFTFEGLKRQRFRWCFGGIQILKKHWSSLIPGGRRFDAQNQLTLAQRYFYLAGGLQWFNDLLNLVFVAFLILGGALIISPVNLGIRPLTHLFIVMPVLLLIMGLWPFLWALRHTLQIHWTQSLAVMGNFFSLGWAISLGSIQGLIQPKGVFMRTPKAKSRSGIIRAVRVTQWETGIGFACLVTGIALPILRFHFSTLFLAFLLAWQASLYLAAPLYSLISIRVPELKPEASRANISGWEVSESRAARWAVALLLLLLVGIGALRSLPAPSRSPGYARFKPVDVPPGQILGLGRVPIPERGRLPTSHPLYSSATPTSTLTVIFTSTEPFVPMPSTSASPSPVQASQTSVPPTWFTPTPTRLAEAPLKPSPTPRPTSSNPTSTPTLTLRSPTSTPIGSLPVPTQPTSPSPLPTYTPQPTHSATQLPSSTWPVPTPEPTSPVSTQTPQPTSPVPSQSVTPSAPVPTPPRPQ